MAYQYTGYFPLTNIQESVFFKKITIIMQYVKYTSTVRNVSKDGVDTVDNNSVDIKF